MLFNYLPYSGVWTPRGKIGFVGLGLKSNAIYHGVAINLLNDLEDYKHIFSCGIKLPVTSLEREIDIYNNKVRLSSQRAAF